MRRSTVITAAIALPATVVALLFGYVLYNGPRMKEQPHIRAFQAASPLPPRGTATVEPPEKLPAATVTSPLAATSDNVERGRVYYRYYCVFCHGETGGGNGPVGESYVPLPTDLRTSRTKNLRDGELLRAMLTGVGHEPVLERVVPPRHRWHLVLYVRSLGAGGEVAANNATEKKR